MRLGGAPSSAVWAIHVSIIIILSLLCTTVWLSTCSFETERLLDRHEKRSSKTSMSPPSPGSPTAPPSLDTPTSVIDSPTLGHLLTLQCGHNASFTDFERERLLHHLTEQGWAVDSCVI